ncbi:MAG: hypothetical protein IKZ87_02560 [Actinomycetaceae bacterium]|nr:hypothetical protein [Actinomycetaceae bacterium]
MIKHRKTKAAITLALSASGLMMTPLLAVADEPSTPDDSLANVPSAPQADLPGESGEVTPAPEPPTTPSEPSPSPETTSDTGTTTDTPGTPGEPGDSGEPGGQTPGEPPAGEGSEDTGTGEQPSNPGDGNQEQSTPTPEPGTPGEPGDSGEVTPAPEPPTTPSEPSPSPSVPSAPQETPPANIIERIVPLPAAPVDWSASKAPSAPGDREGALTLPVTGSPAAPASVGNSAGFSRPTQTSTAPVTSSSQLPVRELAHTGVDDPWVGASVSAGLIGLGTIMIRRAHTVPVATTPRRRGKHAM